MDEEIEFNHNHRHLVRRPAERTAGWQDEEAEKPDVSGNPDESEHEDIKEA